ncbi:cAMP-dependent protein kinase catalytic subunit 3 [Exophiala dermatitidis]|uniref:Non-specific serine/threonine protein kinase n=1 Tax=Exophiala dermatitidis (strain ATCC 34100 / CBS 525.76 / NIH/UT8656) TaxID=858893 RepID=H6BZ43_EXODN|nr:non-specific serine/threonine protein kinase [Exophiala dermatitidis NIH/UT8656]EHY56906.1 non-specific serine/threonine protein kinase [Exophiala dermatitidis NIH/UT8656]
MSTATLQPSQQQRMPRAASAQDDRAQLRPIDSNNSRSASHPHPSRQHEKDLVLKHAGAANSKEVMPPDEISKDPEKKQLGYSSRHLKISDFELMRTLGTGTFARVWLCRFANPSPEDRDKVFALKVLKKVDVIKLKQVEHVRNERDVLAAVAGHPFITTLITSFSDETSLYMLLDYTPGGEIFSYLRRARRFPFATVQFYAAEITLILAYLHEVQFVAYRDLKPENILLDVDGHLKLVDFGFAKYLPPAPQPTTGEDYHHNHAKPSGEHPEPQASGAGVTYTLCGTPEYLAPEVIRNTGHGTAVDWWALGILVYEMLIGQPPFWDQNPMRIYEQIVAGHIRFPTAQPTSQSRHSLHVPRAARDFILALCKTDPTQRLGHIAGGSKRVMEHPFFEGINWDDIYYRRKRGPIIPRVEWAGDAGNFDEYPDPIEGEESEGGRGRYTEELRAEWEDAFKDF